MNRIVSLKEFAEFFCVDFKSILNQVAFPAVSHMLDMWDPLLSYFTNHSDVEKPGKVRTIFSLYVKTY